MRGEAVEAERSQPLIFCSSTRAGASVGQRDREWLGALRSALVMQTSSLPHPRLKRGGGRFGFGVLGFRPSEKLAPGEVHGVAKHLNARSLLRQILSCPAWMLRAKEIAFGVGHQAEDAPGRITNARDAVY